MLKKGGTLRLAVPDYEAVARLYVRHADDPSAVEAKGLEPVTLDTFVSMIFGKWRVGAGSQEVIYHRTAYDEASLRTLLLRNGFREVRRWRWLAAGLLRLRASLPLAAVLKLGFQNRCYAAVSCSVAAPRLAAVNDDLCTAILSILAAACSLHRRRGSAKNKASGM